MRTARLSIHYLLSIENVPEAYRILETVLTMNKHFASCYSECTPDNRIHRRLLVIYKSKINAVKYTGIFSVLNFDG